MLRSILLRAAIGVLCSFSLMLVIMPRFIALMQKISAFQPKRFGTPESHKQKSTTPSMGGAPIIIISTIITLIVCNTDNQYIIVLLLTMISFGALGMYDDCKKIFSHLKVGISARNKIIIQLALACMVIYWLNTCNIDCAYCKKYLSLPWSSTAINLGIFYTLFKACVIVSSSNVTNLTDGLDGLVSIPIIMSMLFFAFVSSLIYYNPPYLEHVCNLMNETAEITVFCGVVIGSILGFLWFNASPAKIFMGDSGSISLGAIIGTIAVITRNELTFVLVGGIFVIEGLSVVLQVASFKLTGKRIFKIAPFHHHLEMCKWSEVQIVIRFWIISILLAMLGLLTLKL